MNKKFNKHFEITRRELRGIIVFLIILLLIYLAPYVFEKWITSPAKITIETINPKIDEIESFNQKYEDKNNDLSIVNENHQSILFKFNPNHLPLEDWMKLGLSEKQARSIKNYESKGGQFRTKADVKKMYVIKPELYEKLEPYIELPENKSEYELQKSYQENKEYTKPTTVKVEVDIATADSAELTKIRGIGPAFASRIVKYRNRLGGFYKKEQLMEVWGLDSAKYEQIKDQTIITSENLKKINVNTCTFDEFRNFPYLSYKQMNAIINYRIQHGNYKSPEDLSKIAILNADLIQKIAPYISF